MGAIDSLLGIVQMKKADGLVLASGEVPSLLLGGARSPLTMPPLSAAMIEQLVEELLSSDERATLGGAGVVESTRVADGGVYDVRVRASGAKLTISLKKGGARKEARGPAPAVPLPVIEAVRPAEVDEAPPPVALPKPVAVVRPERAEASAIATSLDQAIVRGASDVLLSAGARAVLRLDGELVETGATLSSDEVLGYFLPVLSDGRRQAFEAQGSVDFALTHPHPRSGELVRLRANLFRHAEGVAAALRPIWTEVPDLAGLGLPASLLELVSPRSGLVLVTGATGSGKSTTLAALLEHVGRTRACHVVTLEDPIEYRFPRRRALFHQREVGTHVDSFASGLRAALRENPDVVLVGEMRDAETIRLALTAAETGHLVLSTLHSGGAVMAIERILDVFGDSEKLHVRQQLAGVLRHVVAQQLLPGTNGGRIPVLETLAVTYAVAAQIREGRTHMLATQMEIGADQGMVPMERALADEVRAGKITRATALAATNHRESLQKLLDERPTPRR